MPAREACIPPRPVLLAEGANRGRNEATPLNAAWASRSSWLKVKVDHRIEFRETYCPSLDEKMWPPKDTQVTHFGHFTCTCSLWLQRSFLLFCVMTVCQLNVTPFRLRIVFS